MNLLDNALKYNRPLGWIDVSTRYENGESILEIANSGPTSVAKIWIDYCSPFDERDRRAWVPAPVWDYPSSTTLSALTEAA